MTLLNFIIAFVIDFARTLVNIFLFAFSFYLSISFITEGNIFSAGITICLCAYSITSIIVDAVFDGFMYHDVNDFGITVQGPEDNDGI